MLIDRTHKLWFVGSAVMGAISGSAYFTLSRAMPHGMTGGSVAGLLFGIVGSAMMVFAALLAVRKRLPTWRIGSAQWWLRGHLWLGTLGFVLILFHSGFGWGGLVENLLWISFGLVVVTGFAGVALQHVIPKLLTTQVPLETMVGQIPFLSQTNLFRADQLVAKQAGVLDIPFESLKPFAEEALKQQRVLKRESDFPKELAKVYANVPLPDADAKKPHPLGDVAPRFASGDAAIPSPLAQMKASAKPEELTSAPPQFAETAIAAAEAAPVVKPKSPLERMREKAAAANAGSTPPTAVSDPAASTVTAPNAKKSPIEIMREKAAAKVAAEASAASTEQHPKTVSGERDSISLPVESSTAPDSPNGEADASAPNLSPLEQMKAKMAAKKAAEASAASVEQYPTTDSGERGDDVPVPKLSPLEIMKAKMAAKKGSTSDKPADTPKPLTIDKSDGAKPTSEQAASSTSDNPVASPLLKKPMPMTKPLAAGAPPVASTPPKPKPGLVIPAAALAELRDFHLRAVRPFLNDGQSAALGLNDVLTSKRLFRQLKADLPAELHETLDQLEAWCEERRQFNTQLRLHRWLHWWLILHIPPSIALLVLFVAHVIVTLRVVPFVRN